MSSGILTHIRLEPFFQTFLRKYFDNEDPTVFSFPNDHDLLRRIEVLLRSSPPSYRAPKETDLLFRIELPSMRHKNPLYHNYISEAAEKVFVREIRSFFNMVFHEKMALYRNAGFEYKDCITIFQDEYDLPAESSDRLIKEFQRWRNKIRKQKIRQKQAKGTHQYSTAKVKKY